MNPSIVSITFVASLLWACGGSIPAPTQRMADAQAAERSAIELGANDEPGAQLSLRLAQEQISAAKRAMADGDNQRADSLLIRAKADAELAIVQARDKGARAGVQKAVADSNAQGTTNAGQGAVK